MFVSAHLPFVTSPKFNVSAVASCVESYRISYHGKNLHLLKLSPIVPWNVDHRFIEFKAKWLESAEVC